jgi:hypothetical protein
MSAQSSSAGPIPWNEFLEKATCSRCSEPIEKGEERFVVMTVEFKHSEEEEPEGTPARRGPTTCTFLCTVCCGEDEMLRIPNPWRAIRQSRADPSAVKHPGDDATLVGVDDVEKTYAEKVIRKCTASIWGRIRRSRCRLQRRVTFRVEWRSFSPRPDPVECPTSCELWP